MVAHTDNKATIKKFMPFKHEVDFQDFFHLDPNGIKGAITGRIAPICDLNDGRCNYPWIKEGDNGKFYWQRKPRAKDCFGCPRHKKICLSSHFNRTPKT
jgi:hypothetical protein